MAEKNVI